MPSSLGEGLSRLIRGLIADGFGVAEVGTRLGKIDGEPLLSAIEDAQKAVDAGTPTIEISSALQSAINTALVQMAPITLADIRSGWRPFEKSGRKSLSTVLFALFSLLLLVVTIETTQGYHRASTLYKDAIDLEQSNVSEKAVQLFDTFNSNRQALKSSLAKGDHSLAADSFRTSLSDLEQINEKYLSVQDMAGSSLCDLAKIERLPWIVANWFLTIKYAMNVDQISCDTQEGPYQVPSSLQAALDEITSANKQSENAPSSNKPVTVPKSVVADNQVVPSPQLAIQDSFPELNSYIDDLQDFLTRINTSNINPLQPPNFYALKVAFDEKLTLYGSWVLPGLYGMLGAIIYLMRRILDPSLPNPTWLRFPFRILMGGFAGIIMAWVWTPSASQLSLPATASLGTFGLAFVTGYSTDLLFTALDKLVVYLSQLVQKPASR